MMKSKIKIGIDMQDYYDDLLLMRKCIDSQIKELEDSPSICTHKRTEQEEIETNEGKTVLTYCNNCGKIIEGGIDLRP